MAGILGVPVPSLLRLTLDRALALFGPVGCMGIVACFARCVFYTLCVGFSVGVCGQDVGIVRSASVLIGPGSSGQGIGTVWAKPGSF